MSLPADSSYTMTTQPPYPARCSYYTDTKAVQVTLRRRGKWHSRKPHTQIKEVKARKRTLDFVSPYARSPPSLRAGFKPQLSAYKPCSLPGSTWPFASFGDQVLDSRTLHKVSISKIRTRLQADSLITLHIGGMSSRYGYSKFRTSPSSLYYNNIYPRECVDYTRTQIYAS